MLLAGSSRAAGVAHRVRSHTVSRPASPITLAHAHATCTCTYACAYVPIHVHAYVSLKQPVRFLFHRSLLHTEACNKHELLVKYIVSKFICYNSTEQSTVNN